jgi:hypothetical protein
MSPAVAACGVSGGTAARPAAASRHRYFAPIHVSADRVTRTVVGLRPFRPAGFVLRADRVEAAARPTPRPDGSQTVGEGIP